jgi:hypothetical protein
MVWRTAAVEVLRPASGQLRLAVDHAAPGRRGMDEVHADPRVDRIADSTSMGEVERF